MRWKAFFYDKDDTNKYNNKNNTYVDETTDNKFKLITNSCICVLRKYKKGKILRKICSN